ncbi:MAG TPA: hypothetical protein VJ741_09595 [Solirubrobacteraceae bacterium]|nr:hypothetical protein [Solirubrobacteraceae bacterium]
MRRAVATMLALAALVIVLAPRSALADGDPASDVLIGENVFYPYSPTVSTSLQKQLNGETAAAARAHFPIKVALIDTPADLGAIPTLFGKPQQYAHFLVQEISFLNVKPLLLVVMPAGYGTQHLGPVATNAVASLKGPVSADSNDLAQAAIAAVPSSLPRPVTRSRTYPAPQAPEPQTRRFPLQSSPRPQSPPRPSCSLSVGGERQPRDAASTLRAGLARVPVDPL